MGFYSSHNIKIKYWIDVASILIAAVKSCMNLALLLFMNGRG